MDRTTSLEKKMTRVLIHYPPLVDGSRPIGQSSTPAQPAQTLEALDNPSINFGNLT
jgi:hypothetical protein